MALGDDACIFGGKAQTRGGGGVDSGNLVEQIGKPHEFLVVAQVVEHFLGKEEVRQFESAQQLQRKRTGMWGRPESQILQSNVIL